MRRGHLNTHCTKHRGTLLLEVMATLVIFALTIPMLLGIIHEAIVEAGETIAIRQSKMYGTAKLEEYLTELEEEESGTFEDDPTLQAGELDAVFFFRVIKIIVLSFISIFFPNH